MIIDNNYKELNWEILSEYRMDYIHPGSSRTVYGMNSIHKDRYGYIDEDNYFITDDLQVARKIDGPKIEYKINEHGFRSKHFSSIDATKPSAIFAGCSYTFGEGLPEEYLWSSLLSKKLSLPKDNVYNLGAMGASSKLIVKNILSFIRTYGKTDFIFVMLPDIHRDLVYDEKSNSFINCFPHTQWLTSKESKTKKDFTLNYIPEHSIFDGIEYIRMLEDVCSANEVKLVWSTWSDEAHRIYSQLNFNNYVSQGQIEMSRRSEEQKKRKERFYYNKDNLPYWEIAQDDAHPGTFWTTTISELFYKEARLRLNV